MATEVGVGFGFSGSVGSGADGFTTTVNYTFELLQSIAKKHNLEIIIKTKEKN